MGGFYPIFLSVEGARAVVVGGGPVAARKAASLVEAGAEVTVISPVIDPRIAALANESRVTHLARRYEKGDLSGATLVIAATDEPETNIAVADDAKAAGVPVNCVRPPGAGNFIVPSSIHRGGLTVAISTGGGCPALSKRLRKDLEAFLGREYAPFLEFLEYARDTLKKRLPDEDARMEVITRLVESNLLFEFGAGRHKEATERGRRMLEEILAEL